MSTFDSYCCHKLQQFNEIKNTSVHSLVENRIPRFSSSIASVENMSIQIDWEDKKIEFSASLFSRFTVFRFSICPVVPVHCLRRHIASAYRLQALLNMSSMRVHLWKM